jgi:hypothetical protein
MKIYIDGIGLTAPGLPSWTQARAVLNGQMPYRAEALTAPAGACLPATERRRATQVTKLALDTAAQALEQSPGTQTIATVFASSGGEVEVVHHIFSALAAPERQISPTHFHNSVHNAAAGYWSIASGSRSASTSLCGLDDSIAAGLLEAAAQTLADETPVLLIAYDWPPLGPIANHRKIGAAFACALLCRAGRSAQSLAQLDISFHAGSASALSRMNAPELETLRLSNPAARALPLLAALATPETGASLQLNCAETGHLMIEIQPCC